MRHRKSFRKLKRTASHRRAMLGALSTSLLRHKRITTTLAKARETRMVVERLITRARRALAATDAPAAGIHQRRVVARLIHDREVVKELFSTIAEKVGTRPGGYTRIVKLGQRQGDGAEMAVIELVDFNTGRDTEEKAAPTKKKTRTRGGTKKKAEEPAPAASTPEAGPAEEKKGAEKKAEKKKGETKKGEKKKGEKTQDGKKRGQSKSGSSD